jgi:acylphosphatase
MNKRETATKDIPPHDGDCGVKLCISGLVQGVRYRSYARRVATMHSVSGTVRNLPDGSVQVVAWGEPEDLESLIQELRRGPFMARVEDIQVEWNSEGSPKGRAGFDVI